MCRADRWLYEIEKVHVGHKLLQNEVVWDKVRRPTGVRRDVVGQDIEDKEGADRITGWVAVPTLRAPAAEKR